MISAKEILNYGPVSISKWIFYDCPPDCANSGKDCVMYEVWNEDTEELIDAFPTYRRAKKFVRHWMHRQHLLKKALAAAAILSKSKVVKIIVPNCDEPICADADFDEATKVCCWYDDSISVQEDFPVEKDIPDGLPQDYVSNFLKEDFVIFTGDHSLSYCINGITDIRAIAENMIAVESKDGHTYFIEGLDEKAAQKVLDEFEAQYCR